MHYSYTVGSIRAETGSRVTGSVIIIVNRFLTEQQNDTAAAVSMLGTHERIVQSRRSVNTRIQMSQ